MDGVSWSTTRAQESFSRSRTATDTLARLATFIARAETKPHTQSQSHQPSQSPYICQECGKSFNFATELLHHQELQHTLPKPHRCPSCGQEFSLRSSLQLHKCNHNSSPCELCRGEVLLGSPCPECLVHSPDSGKPQSPHRQPHLMDSIPYACAQCGRDFSQKQALLHHQQAGCSEPPSPSDGVDNSSLADDSPAVTEGDSIRSDTLDIPGPSSRPVIVCQFCSRAFFTAVGLQRHKRTNHREEQRKASQDQKPKEDGNGGEARKRGNTKTKVDPNTFSKSKRQLLSCRSCEMVFRSTSKLYLHRKEKHSREKNILREPHPVITKRRKAGIYPCQVCGKLFFHHLSLRAHYRQLHGSSGFQTIKNIIQYVESTAKDSKLPEESSLADHKTVRAGPGRPRKMARVEKRVSDPGRCLEVPQVAEEEEEEAQDLEREFPCPSCAEVFSLQSQLREHVELHQSSVKRRQCSVCTSEMDTCKEPGSKKQRLYHCVPCQQGFSALDSFLEHCQEHLRVRVEEDFITEGNSQQKTI